MISFDEFKKTNNYKKFIDDNPELGYLRVEAFTAYNAIPIPNVEVTISKTIDNDEVLFYKGITDSSGTISNIELPAPKAIYIADKDNIPTYTTYQMRARHNDYHCSSLYDLEMFGDVKIIQYIKMIPEVENGY